MRLDAWNTTVVLFWFLLVTAVLSGLLWLVLQVIVAVLRLMF